MRILGKKLIVEMTGAMICGDVVTIVGLSTNCAINISTDMEEVASLSSNGRSFLPHRYSYTLQVDRLCSFDDNEKVILLWQINRIPLNIRILKRDGDAVTEVMAGKAYISGYSMGAPVEGFASANISLQGTDTLNVIGYGE